MEWFILLTLIHQIEIYPVDSVILRPLNIWGQSFWTEKHLNKVILQLD